MCLGVPGTAGIESLEVEAGVKPLSVRREELVDRQATRIMMKLYTHGKKLRNASSPIFKF